MSAVDTRCLRCGYDLAGLSPEGVCPECALPVADSQVAWARPEAQRHLRALRRGATLLLVSFAVPWLGIVLAVEGGSPFLWWLTGVVVGCAWCGGWWMIGTPARWSPALTVVAAGIVLRACAGVQFGLGLVGGSILLVEIASHGAVEGIAQTRFGFGFLVALTMLFLALFPAVWLAGFLALAQTSRRLLRDRKLDAWCRGMAICTVVFATVVYPPLALLGAVGLSIGGIAVMATVRRRLRGMLAPGW